MAAALNLRSVTRLLDGSTMPVFGLGVWCAKEGPEAENAVLEALRLGYRLIDTAHLYANEESVGNAIIKSGLKREDVFVVSKLWNTDHGHDSTISACKTSLKKLQLDYLDLYLIHSPLGGKHLETWDAMLELKKQGLAKCVGVSNFNKHHIDGIRQAGRETPPVNQIELSPFLQQREVVKYCQENDIRLMAYSPLSRGDKLQDPAVGRVAQSHGRTPAQVMIRYALQHNFVVIPKSVTPERIAENAGVFDFTLSPEDMASLDALDCGHRTCWDPLNEPWDKGSVRAPADIGQAGA